MSEHPKKPEPPQNLPPPSSTSKSIPEIGNGGAAGFSGQQRWRYPNPPEVETPDPATLRDQWRYAIRQYSKWYSHAWGTAILAGVSFFALGWIIKGSNPIPSFKSDDSDKKTITQSDSSEFHYSLLCYVLLLVWVFESMIAAFQLGFYSAFRSLSYFNGI
ncbi:hypothetical protein CCACVL1_15748 [Corchorus capsularis]|uniref:Uncharacterized protein n=1 Tax=Corchorus capsularis TaxID=210143 RepID=A0A1R3I1B8_COCAP|nr:hypothetical protein CCACVL1_15748 [Corchorus capsularis]